MKGPRRRVRVLVVDDSTFARRALVRMLSQAPDIEVVGAARDGREGLDSLRALHPDVVTLDVQMPGMDGLTALEHIMREQPTPVLLLSSLTRAGAEVTLRGLELGALDFVDKGRVQGSMNLLALGEELRAKVRALAGVAVQPALALAPAPATPPPPVRTVRPPAGPASVPAGPPQEGTPPMPSAPPARPAARFDLVVLAASTGGPAALQALLPSLPADLPAAVLVVQHIPPGFTRSLAERLAQRCALPVREAAAGEVVRAGEVLVCPAGWHTRLERALEGVCVRLDDEPRDSLHRPSADVLMASAVATYGSRVLGVVMTGMGADGVEGLRAIRGAGGGAWAQSADSCIIYGMPKAAVEAGVVQRQLPLSMLGAQIAAAMADTA